jgi:hypothetical protein
MQYVTRNTSSVDCNRQFADETYNYVYNCSDYLLPIIIQ